MNGLVVDSFLIRSGLGKNVSIASKRKTLNCNRYLMKRGRRSSQRRPLFSDRPEECAMSASLLDW